MQRPTENSYNVRATSYANYKQNLQWSTSIRTHGKQGPHLRPNIPNVGFQHWCETCDKGFTTARFLENHKLQHQKCKIDGCQFVAHPKIITKHIQMQHSTGLFKKIAKLNNPEDIKKWREERKRKYPTIENMKKKEAELKEKICRGEKMGIKYEGYRRNSKLDFQNKYNHKFSQMSKGKQKQYKRSVKSNRKNVTTNSSKQIQSSKKMCKILPSIEETRELKPFAGIQAILIDEDANEDISEAQHNDPIKDDEDFNNEYTIHKGNNLIEPVVCSALTSLICCYGSSDEDEDIKIPTQNEATNNDFNINNIDKAKDSRSIHKMKIENPNYPSRKIYETKNVSQNSKKQTSPNIVILEESKDLKCQADSDDDSGPEETKVVKEENSVPVDQSNIQNFTRLKKEYKPRNDLVNKKHITRKRNKLPSTLLEKLLHREIQHERNVILQCVRYIVSNNFFDNKQ